MSQATDLIEKFKNATDAASARVKALIAELTAALAAANAPLTPAQAAEADAIVATLDAMGRDPSNPVPAPVVP